MARQRRLRREHYTVGWVCALPIELAAAQEMLDEKHDASICDAGDPSLYTLGCISGHNVVIACLPEAHTGTNSATAVAVRMKLTFTSIRFGLMVGIGGGVPSAESDIRLGDVVICRPKKHNSGVIQYDFGKSTPSGFMRTGFLNGPPEILQNAVANLRAHHFRGESRISEYAASFDRLSLFSRECAGPDILFQSDYDHVGGATCDKCDKTRTVERLLRDNQDIAVHYGTIASGNQVMRDALERDRVSSELGGVLCFEMEAAGLMNQFPCLIIRGICDYSDSHKNKRWQPYAAGAAAAYAKELLSMIPRVETETNQSQVAKGSICKSTGSESGDIPRPVSNKETVESQRSQDTTISAPYRKFVKIRTLKHSSWVFAVSFSPDGKLLATASEDKIIRIWHPATGAVSDMLKGHNHRVRDVAFSRDGKLVASASADHTVKIWNAATGRVHHTIKEHDYRVHGVAFSPNDKLIVSASEDRIVRIWDSATGDLQRSLKGHADDVVGVAFSPNGKLVASASEDKTVKIWDIVTGELKRTLRGHHDWVWGVTFSPDGKLVASASEDKSVRIWDAATGAVKHILKGHSHRVRSVEFSPDGGLLASASDDQTVRIWGATTGAVQCTLKGHSRWVYSVAFSPDGQFLASASNDNTVRLWCVVLLSESKR